MKTFFDQENRKKIEHHRKEFEKLLSQASLDNAEHVQQLINAAKKYGFFHFYKKDFSDENIKTIADVLKGSSVKLFSIRFDSDFTEVFDIAGSILPKANFLKKVIDSLEKLDVKALSLSNNSLNFLMVIALKASLPKTKISNLSLNDGGIFNLAGLKIIKEIIIENNIQELDVSNTNIFFNNINDNLKVLYAENIYLNDEIEKILREFKTFILKHESLEFVNFSIHGASGFNDEIENIIKLLSERIVLKTKCELQNFQFVESKILEEPTKIIYEYLGKNDFLKMHSLAKKSSSCDVSHPNKLKFKEVVKFNQECKKNSVKKTKLIKKTF